MFAFPQYIEWNIERKKTQPEVKNPETLSGAVALAGTTLRQWTILDSNQRPPRCQRGGCSLKFSTVSKQRNPYDSRNDIRLHG